MRSESISVVKRGAGITGLGLGPVIDEDPEGDLWSIPPQIPDDNAQVLLDRALEALAPALAVEVLHPQPDTKALLPRSFPSQGHRARLRAARRFEVRRKYAFAGALIAGCVGLVTGGVLLARGAGDPSPARARDEQVVGSPRPATSGPSLPAVSFDQAGLQGYSTATTVVPTPSVATSTTLGGPGLTHASLGSPSSGPTAGRSSGHTSAPTTSAPPAGGAAPTTQGPTSPAKFCVQGPLIRICRPSSPMHPLLQH